MLKRDSEIRWNLEAMKSFDQVKQELTEELVLISLYFTKDSTFFLFASEHTIATILLQKNANGYEHPISFFNEALRDASLKYKIMEK